MHSQPEVDFTSQQYVASNDATLKEICRRAEARHITVHLRVCPGKPPANLADTLWVLKRTGIANLRLAVDTGLLAAGGPVPEKLAAEARGRSGFGWPASRPWTSTDRLWSVHQPIADPDEAATISPVSWPSPRRARGLRRALRKP